MFPGLSLNTWLAVSGPSRFNEPITRSRFNTTVVVAYTCGIRPEAYGRPITAESPGWGAVPPQLLQLRGLAQSLPRAVVKMQYSGRPNTSRGVRALSLATAIAQHNGVAPAFHRAGVQQRAG